MAACARESMAARARTDVRLLDHADVIGAVADAQRDDAGALDQRGHQGLLLGRHAAAHHRRARAPHLRARPEPQLPDAACEQPW